MDKQLPEDDTKPSRVVQVHVVNQGDNLGQKQLRADKKHAETQNSWGNNERGSDGEWGAYD